MSIPCLHFPNRPRASRRGAALVIVLGFVVLLTLIVVAFLSESTISGQISTSRVGQAQVDVLARSAVQFMKADFRQEIIAGSTNLGGTNFTATNSQGMPVPAYVPSTNLTIVPARTGFTPAASVLTDPYANIVKVSRYQTNFFPVTNYYNPAYTPPDYASQVSTATPALNGRYIDSSNGWTTNGWGRPQLIDSTLYPDALTNAPLPDWIYVGTGGREKLAAPKSDVVGRYAFVVYDEGGLLDVNSAGYNSALASADAYDVARKSSLGLADLTQIPGITNTTVRDVLVAWRNSNTSSGSYTTSTNAYPQGSGSTVPAFLQYLSDGGLNRGFLKTVSGDQKVLSRQELLALQASGTISGLSVQSLAYLGTFSRTLNAPTWTPIDPPGETFTPATANYSNNAESLYWPASLAGGLQEPVYNRDLATLRWPHDVTITRPKLDDDTGTQVETVTFHAGDLVVQHRFPLSKLALLTKLIANPTAAGVVPIGKMPAQGTIAWAVLYYFGLEWNPTGNPSFVGGNSAVTSAAAYEPHWEYVNLRGMETGEQGSGAGYKYVNSVGEVANITSNSPYPGTTAFGPREPDFFEMLEAGILRGGWSEMNLFDIGTCIIDQATPTDIPTLLTFSTIGREWMGRKNLPYLSQMLFWPTRPPPKAGVDPYQNYLEAYLVPVLWNPHRNASTLPNVQAFRIYLCSTGVPSDGVTCELTPATGFTGAAPVTNTFYNSTTPAYQYSTNNDPDATPGAGPNNYIINFKNQAFSTPTILTPSMVTSPMPVDPTTGQAPRALSIAGINRYGFFLGSAYMPDLDVYNAYGKGPTIALLPRPGGITANWPATTTATLKTSGPDATAGIYFRLQCQDTNGVWHSYDEIGHDGLNGTAISASQSAGAQINFSGTAASAVPSFSSVTSGDSTNYFGALSFGPADPRVNAIFVSPPDTRFGATSGLWNASLGGSLHNPTGQSIRPNADQLTVQAYTTNAPQPLGGWGSPTNNTAKPYYPGYLSENSTNNANTTYKDDGGGWIVQGASTIIAGDMVTRPADGSYGAYPMATANLNDRPIILNRPFLSVGELGYAFRSLEWRTVDFSSVVSADSGLLDLFSINDTEDDNQQSMISGVVDLNTHNPAVLQALISGGLINGLDTTGAGITSSDAKTMADAIVAETSKQGDGPQAGPLLNRAQLATRVAPLPDIAAALKNDGLVTKDRREAVVRALAEPADTRTWNLLVDLVVQAGNYSPALVAAGTPAGLAQFNIQGERHIWLHLAIDRYSGKVIDEQVEVVHDN